MNKSEEFARELSLFIPPEARLMVCQFRGDPNDVNKQNWAAKPYQPFRVDDAANVYFCVSAMKRNARGEFRRRIDENFSGGLCLMIDDLGSGPGAKFPLSLVNELRPTALTETSPDNFQAVYFFNSYVTDLVMFNLLIQGFITKKFLSSDTGMAGVNRVFRPPAGVNGKNKYKVNGVPWQVRLADADYSRRYSIKELASAFGIKLVKPISTKSVRVPHADSVAARIEAFNGIERSLELLGMLKCGGSYDQAGWREMTCPWIDHHSGRADTGTAIREPAGITEYDGQGKPNGNDWYGSFRCHHGHCEGRAFKDLAEWVNNRADDDLSAANARGFDGVWDDEVSDD